MAFIVEISDIKAQECWGNAPNSPTSPSGRAGSCRVESPSDSGTVRHHVQFHYYKTSGKIPSNVCPPHPKMLKWHSLLKWPIIIESLDFYCKERIIAWEYSGNAFWIAHREFNNSELIRHWARTGGTSWCINSCQVQTHSISVAQCE